MPTVGLRVAFLSSECEPWAKTGGLADVVDALARALGGLDDEASMDPSMSSCRAIGACRIHVPRPSLSERTLAVPDPRARTGSSEVTVVDVEADGYRLRLVDHPAGVRPSRVLRRCGGRLHGQRVAVRAVRPRGPGDVANRGRAGRRDPRARLAGRAGRDLPWRERMPTIRSSRGRPSSRRCTTSRTTAGHRTRTCPSSGCVQATVRLVRTRTGSTCSRPGSRRPRSSTRSHRPMPARR